jgi:branched-chain amino acid transport system substrate-binding protein
MVRRLPVITTAILCVFLACGQSDGTPQSTPTQRAAPSSIRIAAGEPIVIGVSVALNGEQGIIGQDLADAVDLAIRDFNRPIQGHAIVSTREDDGCNDAELAARAAEALTARGELVGVIGPMCTTGAQAANDVYEAAGAVHISPTTTRDDLSQQGGTYFFRTAWRDGAQGRLQAAYARMALQAETAVVIDDGDPYGKTLADAFVPGFEGTQGRVLSRERIERGTTDFTGIARQIVAARPDVVIFEGLNPEGAYLIRDLRQEGFAGAFVGPDSLLSLRDFVVVGGAATEEATVTGGRTPDEGFVTRFTEAYGRAPSTSFVLQAYDATRILLTSVESVASADNDGGLIVDRAALAQALRDQSFAVLTGSITFDEHGDRSGETAGEVGLAIYEVVDGRFEFIE